jgi:hypothetical protein
LIEQEDPRWKKSRAEQLDDNLTMPYTDIELPIRTDLRMLIELPTCKKSNIDAQLPTPRTMP